MKVNDNAAIIYKGKKIAYSEINEKIKKISFELEEVLRPSEDRRVAIFIDRCPELIITIYSVLSINATYVPIDTNFPKSRIEFIINDSNAFVIVTQKKYKSYFENKSVMYIEDICNKEYVDKDTKEISKDNDIANIIYTSGTTGMPKGVMIFYDSLLNFTEGITEIINFSKGKVIISFTTVSFDIFFLETILALNKGLTVVLSDNNEQNNPRLIVNLIKENNVDMMQVTPSRLQQLINYDNNLGFLKNVKDIMVGGEMLSSNTFHILKKSFNGNIYNLYGPTEATIWCTVSNLTNKNKIDIGKPIKNTEVFVLDESLEEVAVGEEGELYIAGKGLALGYLNREELTRNKFVTHTKYKNKILYRTGDLCKMSEGGNIIILGRMDNQIKLNGFRIEPEEIENVARAFNDINEVIVVLDKTANHLVMHYTSKAEINKDELKKFLSIKLPRYMIPNTFFRHDSFNYTSNNKLDRKSIENVLAENSLNKNITKAIQLSEIETTILNEILKNVEVDGEISVDLELEAIGINSISYMTIIVNLEDEFMIEFDDDKLKYDVFKTVRELIDYVDSEVKKFST